MITANNTCTPDGTIKVAIGYQLQNGPYGGGNSVMRSLAELLPMHGLDVVWTLEDDDIDIIMLAGAHPRSPSISFTAGAVLRYLAFRNPGAVVIQRINTSDQHRGSRTMNLRQRLANYAADHAVCVGTWMLDLDVVRHEHRHAYSVILNGGRTAVFHRHGHRPRIGNEPLRLVTHHWSNNPRKGFDVYRAIDTLLDDQAWADRLEFTYVGNVAAEVEFRNTRVVPPLADSELADELRNHHAYITAAINEPAGMHHIEAALCGLPIIFRRSGGLPEYCDGFGIGFDGITDFPSAITQMDCDYDRWHGSLDRYPWTDTRMAAAYASLFKQLYSSRDEITARRRLLRNPAMFAICQVPL